MAGTVHDPIKDLMTEIAGEQSAAEGAGAAEGVTETPAAAPAGDDKKTPAAAASDDKKPAAKETASAEGTEKAEGADGAEKAEGEPKKSPTKFVPISRINEETAKRRKAERELAAAQERLAALEAAPKDEAGKPKTVPVSEDDRKRIQTEERARARLEVTVESFVNAGYEEFGQKDFDAVSSTLTDLGAPDNLVMIAIEATGSPAAAARAIYALGQQEAADIEKIFQASPIRIGAKLAALATPKAAATPPEGKPGADGANGKGNGKTVSSAPAPIKPVGGSAKIVEEDVINDDLSEDQFTERFNKLMDKRTATRQ